LFINALGTGANVNELEEAREIKMWGAKSREERSPGVDKEKVIRGRLCREREAKKGVSEY